MNKKDKKIRVAVVFGGRSGEHEVSIVSAQSIIKALDKKKYRVVPIGITKSGKWIAGSQAVGFLKQGLDKVKKIMPVYLLPDPNEKQLVKVGRSRGVVKLESAGRVDVFFPVLHGPYGEDGTIQGLFEMANVPYVGAGVLGSAVGMDKIIQKQLFAQVGLKQVEYFWFLGKDWLKESTVIKRKVRKIGYPVFVKPANLGSSVGISKAHNEKEFVQAVKIAAGYDRKVLVEKGFESCREIECSVLGNDNPKASLPGEIIACNEFYDYDAKYVDGKSEIIIPAKLPKPVIRRVQAMAIAAFKALDLAGMARVDFFVKGDRVFINEVNTIPGFTSISMYPKMWEASGLSYSELLDELIRLALERWEEKNKLENLYKPKEEWYK
jgi:D-alanine-D-alanine ligase